jgi:hypothetical protein
MAGDMNEAQGRHLKKYINLILLIKIFNKSFQEAQN